MTLSKKTPALTMVAFILPFLLGTRECETEPPVCTAEYAPVCGVDGVTYGNACEADRAGVAIAHDGECAPEPALCWSDGECDPGERCNHDVCLSPCDEGEICPAVCYGACEPAPEPELCLADEDCGPLDYCHLDDVCRSPSSGSGEADLTVCFGECRPRRECRDDLVCPEIACPFGRATDAFGCPTCECAPEPPACLPVHCTLACDRFQTDAHGCPICACEEEPPPPTCDDVLCTLACEHGFVTDDAGCAICECAPPPPAELCLADDDCAGGHCSFEHGCHSLCGDGDEDCITVCAGICLEGPPPAS